MTATEILSAALADRYLIERLLGEGGMATVYLARDLRHNRPVALKVLRPDLGAVVGVERFLAEIQVTANLQHPNLLPLFDSGAAGELLYYVMPYVPGESLRARLDREKQLPVDEAIRLATAIGGALDYAHRQGVIHRDLKPENVLLQEGQPLVADFGIALAVSNAGGTRITQTGLSLGTPHYMSPEQATGDRVIDARTDIYSLGALTYEMLTGEPPHVGSTSQAIIARVLTERPRPIRVSRPSVPEHVEGAVEHALEKLPADRWASAREFAEALTGVRPVTRSATSATSSVSATTVAPLQGGVNPRRVAIREGAAWALAAAGLGFAAWTMSRTEPVRPVTRLAVELPESTATLGGFFGNSPSVALSRDGSIMAFVASPSGTYAQRTLFVRRLDEAEAHELEGTGDASGPVFSPDNQWLAFVNRSQSLQRVPVAGGASQSLADTVAYPSWGDDGNIYFTRATGIWAVPGVGGTPRLVVPVDSASDVLSFGYLQVLPVSRLAMVRVRGNGGQYYTSTADLRAGTLGRLRLDSPSARFVPPGFLVFQSGDVALSVVRYRPGDDEVTGATVQLADDVERLANGGLDFAVDEHGTILARVVSGERLGPSELVTFDRAGTQRRLRGREDRYDQPRLSQDGRQLLVRVGASLFNNGDLSLIELASGARTRLTSGNSSYRASWSRDGRRIYYLTGNPNTSRVMTKPWDGSGTDSVVLDRPDIAEFAEGPAGGWSAIRTYGPRDILLVPTDSIATATPRPFVTGPANETDVALSPSGTVLAYQSDELGRPEVFVRPVPGPGPRIPVSVNGGQRPLWSRDGTTLFYNAGTSIMAASIVERPNLAVTRRDSLFEAPLVSDGLNLALYPDGRFVAAVNADARPGSPYRLAVISNWKSLFVRSGTTPP